MTRVLSIGEAMVELRHTDTGFDAAVAGDAFNTAVWLRRDGAEVTHAQDLGDDLLRPRLTAALAERGIVWHGRNRPNRPNGMYLVDVDVNGERRFEYFRAGSAAGDTIASETVDELASVSAQHDLVVVTGITVATTGDDRALDRLAGRLSAPLAIAWNVRSGLHRRIEGDAIVARPPEQIGERLLALCRHATVVLASEDDVALSLPGRSPEAVAQALAADGATVVLTRGARGASVWHAGDAYDQPPVTPDRFRDTTGAGDAFAAGFLHGWLRAAHDPAAAAAAGAATAARALACHGALPPVEVSRREPRRPQR
ncbi:MAG TPA: PfkB family carbohydrate kinase [Baekduia sp.]|nr:PfkB family carbohydrate kinase [Baekduia sp.]